MVDDPLNQVLVQLVAEVCRHPPRSRERRKLLTQLIAKMQQPMGEDPAPIPLPLTPEEREAQQRTWIWFCEHIDEYDPEKGTVVGWFMSRLKFRRKDVRIEAGERRAGQIYSSLESNVRGGDEAVADSSLALEDSEQELDKAFARQLLLKHQRFLKSIYFKDQPEVNCFDIAWALLEGFTLVEKAEEYGLSKTQMTTFFNQRCLPRLTKLGR